MTVTETAAYEAMMTEARAVLAEADEIRAAELHNRMDRFVADMTEQQERSLERVQRGLARLAFV